MVFSSNVFLLYFMPAFFLVYFLMPRKTRNYVLLLASLIFYAWGAPEFIIQLVVSTIANYFIVKAMCKTEKPTAKKWLCALSIFISLGLLLFYKYGNFTMENLNALIGLTGHAHLTWKRILLPIGISFFSFQSVTYTLDTYRGVNKPLEKLSDYMLYITMFPQLIAGPIVRYCDVAQQIRQRESTMADRLQGFYRFVIGLSKKILIADVIGLCVDKMLGPAALDPSQVGDIMTRISTLDTGTAWLVALAYTFQIYFDFAGYSDMAIGLGRVMGFKFPENFDNPYTSRSITEFWRRWHKTLGAFIMNYLYIPLGGNRKGTGRMYLNLWLCFLLSGLWHGASWNFVLWGAFHGLFICADKLFLKDLLKKTGKIPSVILTFFVVNLGWVLFRIEDINTLGGFYQALFAFRTGVVTYLDLLFWFTFALAVIFSFLTLSKVGQKLQDILFADSYSKRLSWMMFAISLALLVLSAGSLCVSDFNPFIYFRF